MAFSLYQDDFNTSPQVEYVEATAGEAYMPGELLMLADGKATAAGGSETPVYVCNQKLNSAVEGDTVQVMRLQKNHKLKTTLSAAGDALSVGVKVTATADGMQATATSGGALEIVSILGNAIGDEIIVRI